MSSATESVGAVNLEAEIARHPYWFHRIDLGDGIVTPGWDDPAHNKLPYFGMPAELRGQRVLDIGCAEGFFSFEAERRGASEVVSIDQGEAPGDVKARFDLCAQVLGSSLRMVEASLFELDPSTWGTFDLVLFFGVLYHLRDQVTAVERVASVTAGTLLLQSHAFESVAVGTLPAVRYHPGGVVSGPRDAPVRDRSVEWVPNGACIRALLEGAGFAHVVQTGGQLGRRAQAKGRLRPHRVHVTSATFRATR